MKKIIHISDIHASIHPTKGQARHVLEQLKDAFIKDSSIFKGADAIIVSGDLTFSGQAEEFNLFDKELLQPIKNFLNLENSQIFFAPGNHDTNRKDFSFSQKKAIKSLRENYTLGEVLELQEEIFDSESNPCAGWAKYINGFYSGQSSLVEATPLYQVYKHGEVGVACLNTGWSSIGENDRENLFIGESQIEKALKLIKGVKDKLIVLHHPFDWLHPEERRALAHQISKNGVSAVFYGHMHEFNLLRESSFSDDFVMKLQAGRFDLSGGGYSGYSLISLNHANNLKSGRIFFRKYEKSDEAFISWVDRCPNGQIDFESIPSQGFNREAFADDCAIILEKYEFDLMCNTGVSDKDRKRLTDIFICPAMKIVSNYDMNAQGDEKYIELDELGMSRESYVIVGGENSGKSTILKRLLINKLRDQSRLELDEIVFYYDCKGKSIPSKHRIKSDLVEIYEPAPGSNLYIDILKNKTTTENALIIFDGLDELSEHCINGALEFLKEFKSPRFIISCKHAASQELITKLRKQSDRDFVELNISGMKRSHLKGLIGKWLPGDKERRSVAKEILKAVDNAGMPNNLFVYSMLLSIYERKQGNFSTYLHEADLVENFIEVIMHKHCITNQRAPQYKDLLRLLGYIAESMIERNQYSIKCSDTDALIVQFNSNIAQDFTVSAYLNPILASGVLEVVDGSYRFSQACFFDYAYARYLSTQKINYAELHEKLNFLRFNKVIEYLSAISKSDIELLDFCKALTENAWDICTSAEQLPDLKTAAEELESAAKSDILDEVKDEVLESSLDSEPPKESEIDERLDNSSPLRSNAHNGEKHASWDDLKGATYFLSSLSLYARVFRAAEHLADREVADKHFDAAIDFYEKTIAVNTRKFHEQLRPLVINKLMEHSKFKELPPLDKARMTDNFNAFLNFVVATFPNFTVSMMVSDLINARQISRLKNKKEQSSNNLEKIIISYSLCELDETDTLAEIKSIIPQASYEYSSVIMKIIELSHMDFTLSEEVRKELMAHARTLLKDRKARKLVKDMSKISMKISEGLLDEVN
jgi:predicted phosphodiesterase